MAHTHNGAGANHTGEGNTNNNEEGRQRIEQSIEDIVENLRQFTITIEEYSSESQNRIFEKINTVIKGYENLDNMRNLYDVHVPLEIFDFIDQGKNPDLYIKTYLENCLRANEQTKGKIEAIEAYKNEIDHQLSQLFPKEHAEYKSVHASEGSNHTTSNNGGGGGGTGGGGGIGGSSVAGNSVVHNGTNRNVH